MQTTNSLERLRQLVEKQQARHNISLLTVDDFDAFVGQAGPSLLLFTADPARVPESWDLTVILPELLQAQAEPLRSAILLPEAASALAPRFAISRWPALLLLDAGAYLGTIEGLRDWSVYMQLLPQLLAAAPSRPPGIGIAVHSAAATCH